MRSCYWFVNQYLLLMHTICCALIKRLKMRNVNINGFNCAHTLCMQHAGIVIFCATHEWFRKMVKDIFLLYRLILQKAKFTVHATLFWMHIEGWERIFQPEKKKTKRNPLLSCFCWNTKDWIKAKNAYINLVKKILGDCVILFKLDNPIFERTHGKDKKI